MRVSANSAIPAGAPTARFKAVQEVHQTRDPHDENAGFLLLVLFTGLGHAGAGNKPAIPQS